MCVHQVGYDTELAVEVAIRMAEKRHGKQAGSPALQIEHSLCPPGTPPPLDPVLELEPDPSSPEAPELFQRRFQRALARIRDPQAAEEACATEGKSTAGHNDELKRNLRHLDECTLSAFTKLLDSGLLDGVDRRLESSSPAREERDGMLSVPGYRLRHIASRVAVEQADGAEAVRLWLLRGWQVLGVRWGDCHL